MFLMKRNKLEMPGRDNLLPGRPHPILSPDTSFINGHGIKPPFPAGMETALFGMGCFWGAERKFWQLPGVYATAAGYAGGGTPNPTYEEVCTGLTGHNEVVLVIFNPAKITYEALLKTFWEAHDPTQGMRQGNDVGTQYRSGIYVANEAQRETALASRESFQASLRKAGFGRITSEIADASPFYYAEDHHQQYLAKNPRGYCGLGDTGVAYQIGTGVESAE